MITKNTDNDQNCYVAKKRIVSKLSKIRYQILIAQIEDFNEELVNISRPYLLYFPSNKQSKSVTVGSGDSASPNMVIKLCFNFFKALRAV